MYFKLFSVLISMFFTLSPGAAQEISYTDVLKETFANHPDLVSARLNVEMKENDGARLEGALDIRYGAAIGASDESASVTSPFAAEQTKANFLSAQVTKPFEGGSILTATMNYNQAELFYPASVPANFQSSPNPLYKNQIDLIYRFPLAAGSDNPTYKYQKRANAQEISAAKLSLLMKKEQLASQGLGLYFQLLFNDLSLELAKDGVTRAKQLLAYQKKREKFGLIEKSERLQAEALLAMREMQKVQATSARNSSQIALNRFMFRDEDTFLKPSVSRVVGTEGDVRSQLEQAKTKRPVFAMFEAQLSAARERLELARASDDYKLDLVAQVGSRALDGTASGALEQGTTLNDRYIGITLEFSDVWSRSAERAAVQQSVLALESIKVERLKVLENLETELASIQVQISDNRALLEAARKQAQAEKVKYAEEMRRYQEGRATTAMISQFEGDLRAAELRELIQRVALVQVGYQKALALGELAMVLGDEQ